MTYPHSSVNNVYEENSIARPWRGASHGVCMDAGWLKGELEKPGRSQAALARFMRLEQAIVNRMANGKREIKAREADQIHAYLAGTERSTSDTKPATIARLNAAPGLQMLPIRFRVQAGAWLRADVYATQDYGEGPIPADPRIPAHAQWLEEVVGESMNNIIAPGLLVHVVDPITAGYTPRDGDLVIIERTRRQGAEIERSIKRVWRAGDGWEFRGDSSIAEFNDPIPLIAADNDDTDEVRIAGWVRHAIRRF